LIGACGAADVLEITQALHQAAAADDDDDDEDNDKAEL